MSTYPVTFETDYVEQRSRLTTFFRLLLAIPHFLILALYGAALVFIVIAAWFVLLFTGRWPVSLYQLTAGYMRWHARLYAYAFLLVDPYPPFSIEEEPGYPARLNIAPPQAEYSRLKVLLRIFYVIPAVIIVYVLNLVLELVGFVAWLVIVVTAKQPKGLQDVIKLCVSYMARVNGLFLLVTETYPPFSDDSAGEIGQSPPAPPLPPEPMSVAPEVPAQAAPAPTGGFEPPAPPPPAAAEPEPEPEPEPQPEPPPADEPPPGPFGPTP